MRAAACAIEALRALVAPGMRASCVAAVLRGALKAFAPRGKRVLANLEKVYPDSSPQWRQDLRARLYEHLGWMVAEILVLQRDPTQAFAWIEEVRNAHFLDQALSGGKGVLFLSGHYGNWELLAAWYAQYLKRERGQEFTIVVRDPRDKDVARLIAGYRERCGIRLLPRGTSTLEMVRILKAGGHIAALADIAWKGGVRLPFMGHLCGHTTGPAVLSLLASVSIIPVALYREGPFRHRVEFFEPLAPGEDGDRRHRIEQTTRAVGRALEEIIAPHPDLWFWLHNRWK